MVLWKWEGNEKLHHRRGDAMKALHENIKNFRQLRKMTQKDFAAQLNKSRNVISNWERGTNAPDPDTIEQICHILNVTPNMLFGWDKCPDYERFMERMRLYSNKIAALTSEKERIESEIKKYMDMSKEENFNES